MTARRRRSGLPPGPWLPGLVQAARLWHDPVGFQRRAIRRHGEPVRLRLHPAGPVAVVSDPRAVADVVRGDPDVFRAGEANGRLLPVLAAGSLLRLDGDEHRRRRQQLVPAFHGRRLGTLEDTIRDEAQRALGRWPTGRAFPLMPRLRALTLRVMLRAVVDLPRPDERDELGARAARLLTPDVANAVSVRRRGPWPRWSPLGAFARRRAAVDALVHQELQRRRRNGGPQRHDALDALIGATTEAGGPLDDQSICDEIATLLIAGHETTSTALAWTFERLVRHPPALERARAAARDGDPGYLDAVVKESLRCRPPLVDTVRTLASDATVGDRRLPGGTTVMAAIPLVHQRPELYPQPEAFRPERFLDQQPKPHEWLPFGGGIRRCIGAELAALEMATVLATVLAEADLRPARPRPERSRLLATALTPSRGASVVLHRPAR